MSYENKRKHLMLLPYWYFAFIVSAAHSHFNLEIFTKTKFE